MSFKRYLLVLGVFVVPLLYAIAVSLGGSNGPGRQLFMPKAPTAIVQPSGGSASVDEVMDTSKGWQLPSVAPTASPGGVERPSLVPGGGSGGSVWMVPDQVDK